MMKKETMKNETNHAQNMIERYVHAVTKRVPRNSREDIEIELKGLIEDDLLQREGSSIEEVLLEYGNPMDLAEKYMGNKRHLIGPMLFETYLTILKIVIPAVLLGITVSLIVGYLATPDQTIWQFFGNLLGSWWGASFQAFAFVTIGFGLAEHFSKGKDLRDVWKPEMLPEIEKPMTTVKLAEPIAAIVLSSLFLVLVNTAPQLIAIFIIDGGFASVPIINLEMFASLLFFVNVSIVLGIVKELVTILIGRHTWQLSVVRTILSVVVLLITLYVLRHPGFLNQNINSELLAVGHATDFDWLNFLQQAIRFVIFFSILGFVVDTIATFVKVGRSGGIRIFECRK